MYSEFYSSQNIVSTKHAPTAEEIQNTRSHGRGLSTTLHALRIVYICMDMNSIPARAKDSKRNRRRENEKICHHHHHHSSHKESGNLVQDLSKIQATILGNLQDTYFIRQLLFFTSRHSATHEAGQIIGLHYYIKELTGNGNR